MDAFEAGPHLLGRIPSPPDPRDYKLAGYLEETVPLFPPGAPAVWRAATQLDQDATSHCVAFGWTHLLNADPLPDDLTGEDAHELYYRIKVEEGEPGQENGAWVRTGAKVLQADGKLGTYAFAATGAEARAWIRSAGPVAVGTWWRSGMYRPDRLGFVFPTGSYDGGHCFLILGDVPDRNGRDLGYAICQNSWGQDWGPIGGHFLMSWSDLDPLLQEDGEIVTAVELAEAVAREVCPTCQRPLP